MRADRKLLTLDLIKRRIYILSRVTFDVYSVAFYREIMNQTRRRLYSILSKFLDIVRNIPAESEECCF
jgi:hypothetical protein